MPNSPIARALGVDACKKGWVGVTTDRCCYFAESIGALVDLAQSDGGVDVVAIDIPIGLPTQGAREADKLARRLIGKRSSSVFTTPVRPAVQATTYAEANELSKLHAGNGISQQAFALGRKILEVDRWAASANATVIEVHPEVSFRHLAGRPLEHPKSTWAGVEERRSLLAAAGVIVPSDAGLAGAMAGVDDLLDAAVASWTGARFAFGAAVSHPSKPEEFGDGHAAAIWA